MTGEEIFKGKIETRLNENVDKVKAINAVYAFELTGDNNETWVIDLTKDSGFVSQGPADNANCTVTIATSDLVDIIEKKLNPQMAFMTGKLKVKGDMGLALNLGSIL
ncbi:MAG: SCP2 sterol-binding domain-containing protein [Deltaproteobacteria bacterium]|nr:SCP2 sterol-binding domain-containing protein [Deltaproteobacteria bacterium]